MNHTHIVNCRRVNYTITTQWAEAMRQTSILQSTKLASRDLNTHTPERPYSGSASTGNEQSAGKNSQRSSRDTDNMFAPMFVIVRVG